jgi:hypothetical protein
MENNIARIDDLVQFIPDTLARALHKDKLPCLGEITIWIVIVGLDIAGRARQKLGLLESFKVGIVHCARPLRQIFNCAEVELRPLSLRFLAKSVLERLRRNGDLGRMLLQPIDVALFLNQAHGQLVALHEERGRVGGLRLDGGSERVEGILGDYTRVVEPLPVGLNAGNGRFSVLVRCCFLCKLLEQVYSK